MTTSAITIATLRAVAGFGQIALYWDINDPYRPGDPLSLGTVEIWAALDNTRDGAEKKQEIKQGRAAHVALTQDVTWYFWARARDQSGNLGDWYPSSPSAGIVGRSIGTSGAPRSAVAGQIVASVSANALTLALKTIAGNDPSPGDPVYIPLRDADLTKADYVVRIVTAPLSLTIPNGAALAAVNATAFRCWFVFVDVGDGTVKIAVSNRTTATASYGLAEYAPIATTAIDASANTAGVFYADAALASKVFKIGGFFDYNSGLATAGAWSATPDLVHMFVPGTKTPGDIITTVQSIANALSTIVNQIIPLDTTIPQNTEGAQYLTNTIVPSSPVNYLSSDIAINAQVAGAGLTYALFRDAVANALVAGADFQGNWTMEYLQYRQLAKSIASTTIALRLGTDSNVTVTLNGANATGYYGGVLQSYLRTSEIMA